MKNILVLHNNVEPHTSLCTREAITKIGLTVLPHLPHSPDMATSHYHLFGSAKDSLHARHSADGKELKLFHDVLQS
jgi:hypothetical protein